MDIAIRFNEAATSQEKQDAIARFRQAYGV
jgi:hypothetical protein